MHYTCTRFLPFLLLIPHLVSAVQIPQPTPEPVLAALIEAGLMPAIRAAITASTRATATSATRAMTTASESAANSATTAVNNASRQTATQVLRDATNSSSNGTRNAIQDGTKGANDARKVTDNASRPQQQGQQNQDQQKKSGDDATKKAGEVKQLSDGDKKTLFDVEKIQKKLKEKEDSDGCKQNKAQARHTSENGIAKGLGMVKSYSTAIACGHDGQNGYSDDGRRGTLYQPAFDALAKLKKVDQAISDKLGIGDL